MKLYNSVSDNIKYFIKDSRIKKTGFEKVFTESLSNIESLRSNYEAEQELLDIMKGEALEGEALSREEQLRNMKAGIKAAFKLNHKDMNELLNKSGRVTFGNYDGALERL